MHVCIYVIIKKEWCVFAPDSLGIWGLLCYFWLPWPSPWFLLAHSVNPTTFATYSYAGDVYQIQSVGSSVGSGQYLAPEWDSENSTYYVRLVDADSSAAKYEFTHNSREIRSYVAVNAIIKNADTQRFLAWRDEGGEKFLVEADTSDDDTSQGFFKFTPDQFVRLPCPLIFQARCQAYDIVSGSDPSSGLTAYEEDGAIYFKLAADDLVPFVLRTTQTKSLKSLL